MDKCRWLATRRPCFVPWECSHPSHSTLRPSIYSTWAWMISSESVGSRFLILDLWSLISQAVFPTVTGSFSVVIPSAGSLCRMLCLPWSIGSYLVYISTWLGKYVWEPDCVIDRWLIVINCLFWIFAAISTRRFTSNACTSEKSDNVNKITNTNWTYDKPYSSAEHTCTSTTGIYEMPHVYPMRFKLMKDLIEYSFSLHLRQRWVSECGEVSSDGRREWGWDVWRSPCDRRRLSVSPEVINRVE